MSAIVTSILSSTVGLLWDKARDSTAAKLKDGDVTDAKIRELVVRELSDVKVKLDGILRKDLLSSYRFLQEGVDLLNVSLGKSKSEQTSVVNYRSRGDGGVSRALPSGVEFEIVNDAFNLSRAFGKLNEELNEEFDAAEKRFQESRKRATDAFCNEALSVNDKIFAAKLRVVSELLEGLKRPETSIIGCLSFLKELNSLPAVQEIFSVYLDRGVKSWLNKTERVRNVKSVMLINYVLYQYVSKFSTKYSFVLAWPDIELADCRFHPILDWQKIASRKSMGKDLVRHPNTLSFEEDIDPRVSAVDSYGNVIVGKGGNLMIISRNGESRVAELPRPSTRKVAEQRILGIAVDRNNNVYICVKIRTGNSDVNSYMMYILDNYKYNVKHEFSLDYQNAPKFLNLVNIAINKSNDIIMIGEYDPNVYTFDNTGQFKRKFEAMSNWLPNLSFFKQDEIMITNRNIIRMYTEEGNRTSTIEVQEGHEVIGVAFHFAVYKIIALTFVKQEDCCYLLCFSENGKQETTFLFSKRIETDIPQVRSNLKGHVVVIRKRNITFI